MGKTKSLDNTIIDPCSKARCEKWTTSQIETYCQEVDNTTRTTVADIHVKNSNPVIRLAKVTELENSAEIVKDLTLLVRQTKLLKDNLVSPMREVSKQILVKTR